MSIATCHPAHSGLRHSDLRSDAPSVRPSHLAMQVRRASRTDACGAFGTFRPTVWARGAPGEETTRH